MLILKSHPATRTAIGGDPTPTQAASGDYPKLRQDWHGLKLAIEHPEGTVRDGVDETGKPWRTVFKYAYGEIIGTTGMDGDPVDVFIGQDQSATHVYIVQQMKRKQWDKADEQKCMINFSSEDDAKTAYLNHYDDPRFFGGITAMPVDEFVRKVRATREKPAMVKGFGTAILFLKAHVGAYVRNGKLVNLAGYQGRNARPSKEPGQIDLFSGREHGAPLPPLGPNPYKSKHPVKDTPDLFAGGDQVTEPRADLVAEHKRLVDVLRSPSHEDDKAEADRQEKELRGYEGGGEAPAAVTPESDLPTGATIADSKGRQYRVHYMRHGLIVAHPIVDGKPQVSADTGVRFWVDPDRSPSGDNDRTDPVTVAGMPDGYRMDGGRAVRATEH